MRDQFHGLIELRPVASCWLFLGLLAVVGFTGLMLLLADTGALLTVALLLGLLLWGCYEGRRIARQPELIRCLPDGHWSGLWQTPSLSPKPFCVKLSSTSGWFRAVRSASTRPGTTKNLTLERHFLLGSGSITLLVRDSEGRSYRLWCLKNACPDPQWRRLKVLLRWPDATKGQGNH
jgi:hypothetical protein